LVLIGLALKLVPYRRTRNKDGNHKQHAVLGAIDVVTVDLQIITPKITTIVLKITIKIMTQLAQRISNF